MITPDAVRHLALGVLGLDPEGTYFDSREAIAAQARRAAAFMAPCSVRALREAVLSARRQLGHLPDARDEADLVDGVIDSLVAYGDLLELPANDDARSGTALYLAPLSYVVRQSGTLFLLGIGPDGSPDLPEYLRARVEHRGHTRRIARCTSDVVEQLRQQFRYHELPDSLWRPKPRAKSSAELLKQADERLSKSNAPGDVVGLIVLDSSRSVDYYPRRWTEPRRLTGRYVARRDQRYGSALWSYVELLDGQPTRLVDLPPDATETGADKAWHLQMAIDARSGSPQRFTVEDAQDSECVLLRFFSPVPRWAQHRWELLGERVTSRGCLFAYSIPAVEYPQEREVLVNQLWMEER
jgi:hypothetical protein